MAELRLPPAMKYLAIVAAIVGAFLLALYGYGRVLEHRNYERDMARAVEWGAAVDETAPETPSAERRTSEGREESKEDAEIRRRAEIEAEAFLDVLGRRWHEAQERAMELDKAQEAEQLAVVRSILPCDQWPKDYKARGGGWGVQQYSITWPDQCK